MDRHAQCQLSVHPLSTSFPGPSSLYTMGGKIYNVFGLNPSSKHPTEEITGCMTLTSIPKYYHDLQTVNKSNPSQVTLPNQHDCGATIIFLSQTFPFIYYWGILEYLFHAFSTLTQWRQYRPKPSVTSLCSTSDVMTFGLYSNSAGGKDLSSDAQNRVIGLIGPEICTRMLRNWSEKLGATPELSC